MKSTDIFATEARQKVLDENNIWYAVDDELNLVVKDEGKVREILKAALEL